MDQWKNKVAVVTGASTGMGAAIAVALVRNGMIVIGMARRVTKIDDLKAELTDDQKTRLHSRFCDLNTETSILEAFNWVDTEFKGIDVLINNAGLILPGRLSDANNSDAIRNNVQTNFLGVTFCARQTLLSLERRQVDGHIVNINSIWGHYVPRASQIEPNHNVYHATKFAVTALTESLIQELVHLKRKTKVTSISPGATATERIRKHFDAELLRNCLKPEDIADAVVYVLGTPPNVQITELTIRPTGETL